MPKVTFISQNGETVITAESGALLSDLLLSGGSPLEMPCGGKGRCGKCRVRAEGALSKATDVYKRQVGYLLHRLHESRLETLKALKKCGADAYIGSETYCSADIISPALYSEVVFPAQQYFYQGLRKMGLYAFSYFLGDLFPMMEDIKQLGLDALLVERYNKGLDIDIHLSLIHI